MSEETFGQALHRLRKVAGYSSLRAFAKAVNFSHVYLWQMESGAKVPPTETAEHLDQILGAHGRLARLAAASPQPVAAATTDDPDIGLAYAQAWPEGVETVTKLWAHDAKRRSFLAGAGMTAAAYAVPAMRWLTTDISNPTAAGRVAVGAPHVATVRETTAMWRRLDNRYGGGHARASLVRFLDGEVGPLLRDGRYDPKTGRQFAAAAAELTLTTGWAAYDTGRHGLAQRYFIQALRLAQEAKDRALGAEILSAMSHQAVFLGEAATAVDLARTARTTAASAGIPALVAEAHVTQAHAHAIGGDERACTASLAEAERALDAADRSADPAWINYFGQAYLSAKFGWCFLALGKAAPARRFAEASLDMDGANYVRGKAFNLALLGRARMLGAADPAGAADAGLQALTLTDQLQSARAATFLTQLADELIPHQRLPQAAQFRAGAYRLAETAGGAGQ